MAKTQKIDKGWERETLTKAMAEIKGPDVKEISLGNGYTISNQRRSTKSADGRLKQRGIETVTLFMNNMAIAKLTEAHDSVPEKFERLKAV